MTKASERVFAVPCVMQEPALQTESCVVDLCRIEVSIKSIKSKVENIESAEKDCSSIH